MAVTIEQFVDYIGGTVDDHDDQRIVLCLEVAEIKVHQFVRSTCVDPAILATSSIPTVIVDIAIMKVADELYRQRNITPSPREQIDYGSGVLSNTSRDPMSAAYPVLRGYLLPW